MVANDMSDSQLRLVAKPPLWIPWESALQVLKYVTRKAEFVEIGISFTLEPTFGGVLISSFFSLFISAQEKTTTIHEIPRNITKHYLCSFVEFVDRFLSIEATSKSERHSIL
jgi:hypothetical protein